MRNIVVINQQQYRPVIFDFGVINIRLNVVNVKDSFFIYLGNQPADGQPFKLGIATGNDAGNNHSPGIV